MNPQREPTAQHQGNGRPQPQSRILVFQMLEAAGSQGCATEELVEAIMAQCGTSLGGAKAVLFKGKKKGLIYGKGVYVGGNGMQLFRYFATAAQCEEFVFEGVPTKAERLERKRKLAAKREAAKRAGMTPEERAAHNAIRNERLRANIWRSRGYDEPPPKRVVAMTAEQRAEMARKRVEALAEGKRLRAMSREERRKAERAAQAAKRLPGRRQVVTLDETAVPVSVPKRPVLIGEPIITSATRMTIAPVGRDYRFWVDPAEVRPVFGAMPLGRYLEVDGTAARR